MTKAGSSSTSAKKATPAKGAAAGQKSISSYFFSKPSAPSASSVPKKPAKADVAEDEDEDEKVQTPNRFSQFAAGGLAGSSNGAGLGHDTGSGQGPPPRTTTASAPSEPINVDSDEDDVEEVLPTKKRKLKKRVVDSDSDFEEVGGQEAGGSGDEDEPMSRREESSKPSLYDALVSHSPQKKKALLSKDSSVRRVNIDAFRHNKSGTNGDAANDTEPTETLDPAEARRREARREEFVRKFDLHVADEMLARKRRRGLDGEDEDGTGEDGGEPDEEEPEEEPKSKKQKTSGKGSGKAGGGTKFTPLELQFLELRKQHPGVVLVIEVGYKFRFFDEDARTAAKHLGIVAYHDHNFLTCSIPVHRLPVHVKKLVASGYKVGVVRQIETAALKKTSDNRNAPFTRRLTGLYTKSTMVDDLGASDPALDSGIVETGMSGFLVCLWETLESSSGAGHSTSKGKGKAGAGDGVKMCMLAVQVNTGEVVFDEWVEKGGSRADFETRLLHLHPAEMLLPATPLSAETERLISSFVSNLGDDAPRIERVQDAWFRREKAKDYLAQFRDRDSDGANAGSDNGLLMSGLAAELPEGVQVCLAALLRYLQDFGLSQVLKITSAFSPFVSKTSMVLDANALRNLEVFETSIGKEGSLVSIMDRTVTGFGSRMMRSWIAKPLVDVESLRKRTDAVEHLLRLNKSATLTALKELLKSMPDLERSITRIRYNRIQPNELLATLDAFGRCVEFAGKPEGAVLEGAGGLLAELMHKLPEAGTTAAEFMDAFDHEAARENKKTELFMDNEERGAKVRKNKQGIARCEEELEDYLKEMKKVMKGKANVEFVSVAKDEYLLEIKKSAEGSVPKDWRKFSGTKAVSRFRTPFIDEKMEERQRFQEMLTADAEAAWVGFIGELSERHDELRSVVKALADLDCLCGLAIVAQQAKYCKPTYSPTPIIEISKARHPMLELQLSRSSAASEFVPNDFVLDPEQRCIVLTGPNMGGKSCAVRTLALVCIMAQIGSYVPAESAKLGMLDAVHTRMGASDTLQKSTFMVELSETGEIMRTATPRSLVILDELGRGTSTHDGMAVAYGTMRYFAEQVKSLTVFVTHYPAIGRLEKELGDKVVRNFHMGFLEQPSEDTSNETTSASTQVVFLYKLTPGIAARSYGLNVARLARLPESVLDVAAIKAREAQEASEERERESLAKRFREVWVA